MDVIKIRKYIIEEKNCPQVMSNEGLEELNWTAWLDFDNPLLRIFRKAPVFTRCMQA
jgi:hypothetical protein